MSRLRPVKKIDSDITYASKDAWDDTLEDDAGISQAFVTTDLRSALERSACGWTMEASLIIPTCGTEELEEGAWEALDGRLQHVHVRPGRRRPAEHHERSR